jgi:WD40 repeat protein
MSDSIPSSTLEKFTTFGDLLRFLRRRAGITQLELSIAVGYSDPHISRLEQNARLPDVPTIQARFIAPLCLEDEPRAVARLIELASEVRREDAPTPGLCPYKGMDYFDEADADLFVGREALTEKLTGEVLALASKSQFNYSGFMAIVGASGSGKSSLVRAGVVPALRWNKSSANWTIHVLTPSVHPLESLATSLDRNASLATTVELMDDLARDHRALSLYVNREIKTNTGSYLLLVIDQFEELFALCHADSERAAFIDNLLTAAFDPNVKAMVVITLRADFYAHCAGYPQLRQALAKHQEYIGAMSDEEMRRAIEEPARRGHWEFEPGLVDLILHDVGHEPGALPLLSHALLENWERRRGRRLTFSGYASSGGVRGAIAETAESVFADQFTHEQQIIARRIFLRLTELGDETATGDTRRRATFNELILKPEQKDATQAVLKVLADARLITTSENSVQVAHEALIREWPTLRGWLEDNREGLRLHRQLTEAAQDWQVTGGELDMLFRGARLAQAREWATSHEDDMNSLEKEFLKISIASSEQETAEREAARQRELEAAQKLAESERHRAEAEGQRAEEQTKFSQRLKRRAILISVFGAIALLLAVFAMLAWKRSAEQVDLNRSLSLAGAAQALNISGQRDLALLLAVESAKLKQPPPEALTALRTVATGLGTRAILSGHSQAVRAVAFSPDRMTAFSGSCAQLDSQALCSSGELILWDLEALKELHHWSAHSDWVTAVAYSMDGQTLISGSEDGSLLLWDMNGTQTGQLSSNTGSITALALVSGNSYLLSASSDGSLILWDLKAKKAVRNFNTTSNPITALAIANGNSIAVTGHQDGSLILWDLENPGFLRRFQGSSVSIKSVAITPDAGKILFTTSTIPDFYLRIIDGNSGNKINEKHFACDPGYIVLSLDFATVFTSCITGLYQIGITDLNIMETSMDSAALINALSISHDGSMGLSASLDGTIRLWNLGTQQNHTLINISPDEITAIVVSSDGKYLLLGDGFKNGVEQPVLWDLANREIVMTYPNFDGIVFPGALAISPDERFVAAAGFKPDPGRPIVMIWDLQSGRLQCDLPNYTEPGRAVAFSPDSAYLLAGSQVPHETIGHLILWDVQTCHQVLQFDTDEEVTSIQFSRDGKKALTGSSQLGRAILWDISTGKEIKRFSYAKYGPLMDAVFGPDETTVLGTGGEALYLWNVKTGDLVRTFTGNKLVPMSAAVSADGEYVFSGDVNGDVILWDFLTGELLGRENLGNMVFSVALSTDCKTAYAASVDGKLIQWTIVKQSLPELLDWIAENRYVRELTEYEKIQYLIEP